MAVKMNLWSLTLLPGEKYPLYIRRDFTITNVALGEELRNANGRSVVKVTHHPLPPIDSDSDDELDSDEEAEMGDEFELGSDEEADASKLMNGDKDIGMEEDVVEVEGDDEAEDEEDDDYSQEEMEETLVLCSLTAGRVEQATLDLTFVEGEAVMFEVSGENAVHLVGNYINQVPYESDSDSDYSGEDDFSDIDDGMDSEDEEVPAARAKAKITEIPEVAAAAKKAAASPAAQLKPKVKAEVKPTPLPIAPVAIMTTKTSVVDAKPSLTPKRKADAIESPASKPSADAIEGMSKTQKKKLAKKQRTEGGGEVKPSGAAAKPAGTSVKGDGKPQKKLLPSGLVIEDVKVGDGPVAKTGKRLGMRYIGKLENGMQFDANTAGKPFSFMLGKGEVISGWDQGLAGMAVGGERRLTIPAGLAYGNQKIPGIPKNSTLKFDVKLVSVV